MTWEIRQGDALECLREMPDESVQTVVTSPPYWGLRDYGDEGQLGLEPTPEQYVANLVAVFGEVRRVLRSDGTAWLNLGDSYAAQGGSKEANTYEGKRVSDADWQPARSPTPGLKPKDLVGVPWRVAFALQADGWWLRSDIIWAKKNCMPESVTDRPTRSHEYLFLLSKSARYFFDSDAVREVDQGTDHHRNVLDGQPSLEPSGGLKSEHGGLRTVDGRNGTGRNLRSVWHIGTQPYPEAHFATFPPKLVEPCILAGSPPKCCGECGAPWERVVERDDRSGLNEVPHPSKARDASPGFLMGHYRQHGKSLAGRPPQTLGWQLTCAHEDDSGRSVVLDPFTGSGTTGVVALRHDRSFIGIELSPDYCELARNRIRDDQPLFNYNTEVAA